MKIPESMKDELGAWNGGDGIDLESWISYSGNFSLAVGYTSIFCPKFVEFEDYIFATEEMCEDSIRRLRGFERHQGSMPLSIEWTINHIHIADLHYRGCEDLSIDKIILLGHALKEIYEARLHYLFPNKPCSVEFYQPENPDMLEEYQLSFWQKKHE